MRNFRKGMFVGLLLLITFLTSACSGLGFGFGDKTAVNTVLDKFAKSILTENELGMLEAFADPIVIVYEDNTEATVSRNDFLSSEEQWGWGVGSYTTYTIGNRVISITGNTATVTTQDRYVLTVPDSEPIVTKAEMVYTLEKVNGKWIITRLHVKSAETTGVILL